MAPDAIDALLAEIARQQVERFLRAGHAPAEAKRLAQVAISVRAQETVRRRTGG
jgi:hypothetical protein